MSGREVAAPAGVRFYDPREVHDASGLREEIDAALLRVAASGRYLLGEEIDAFEERFARYCGAGHCVAVGSGFDALRLTLRALGVGSGDEVIVPSHTFVATWLAVSEVGATPVPVEPGDEGPSRFLIDPDRLEAALTARTRAVVPVHLYGHPVDLEAVESFARRHGLPVVEDAAQAHGARHRGTRVGGGYAAAFSFYPGKNLGALGDGGAVVTSDPDLARRLRLLRNYGSREKYRHEARGVNSRLDELQAAVLSAQLPHLDTWNARRREIADRYTRALAGLPGITVPSVAPWAEPVWHQYVLRATHRDRLRRLLAEAGVETHVHYPVAVHDSRAYAGPEPVASAADPGPGTGAASAQWARPFGDLPRARRLATEVLSLPIGPHLSDDAVATVVAAVRSAAPDTREVGP
ncbi:DegT/DnrJ/EryC1/StrS family aminotransferase [Nocardiopsis sp. EMB25]|uniref:DegT/DnrJ/EryC1/StrS family aminotransferase n=1 Tax=Nocardiopsis TaxID=2013 RepID=UPI000346BD05|nr:MULTISPECIES: DegT/DnrJ/EryC1/StrS family aminotransferase [Nocardiopsis]MCY9787307.1 DegT/DnrJ/EryC1/StrS family aminotransferase [Nocardiopsis sp. EMB25]